MISLHLKIDVIVDQSLQSNSAEFTSGVTSTEVVSRLPVSLQSEHIEASLQRSRLEVVFEVLLEQSGVLLTKGDGGLVDLVNLLSRVSTLDGESGESVPSAVKVLKEGLD